MSLLTESNRPHIENICFDAGMKRSAFNRRVFQLRKEQDGKRVMWSVSLLDTEWNLWFYDQPKDDVFHDGDYSPEGLANLKQLLNNSIKEFEF